MNHPGLCVACDWLRVIESRRGSVFFLCGRSKVDERFPRYPAIPVLTCRGFEPKDPDAEGAAEKEGAEGEGEG